MTSHPHISQYFAHTVHNNTENNTISWCFTAMPYPSFWWFTISRQFSGSILLFCVKTVLQCFTKTINTHVGTTKIFRCLSSSLHNVLLIYQNHIPHSSCTRLRELLAGARGVKCGAIVVNPFWKLCPTTAKSLPAAFGKISHFLWLAPSWEPITSRLSAVSCSLPKVIIPTGINQYEFLPPMVTIPEL